MSRNDAKFPYYNVDAFLKGFLKGGGSAGLATTLSAPVHRIQFTCHPRIPGWNGGDLMNTIKTVYKEQGFPSLFKGNFTNVLRTFTSNGTIFGFKELITACRIFPSYNPKYCFEDFFVTNLLIGGLAGAAAHVVRHTLVDYPTAVKSQKAVRKPVMNRLQSLSLGLPSAIVYRSIYFGVYDTTNAYNPFHNSNDILHRLGSHYLVAQTVVLIADYVTMPLDIVCRYLYQQHSTTGKFNMIKCNLKSVFRNKGSLALLAGRQRVTLSTLQPALVLVIYSEIDRFARGGVDTSKLVKEAWDLYPEKLRNLW